MILCPGRLNNLSDGEFLTVNSLTSVTQTIPRVFSAPIQLRVNDILGNACLHFFEKKEDIPIYVDINGRADEALYPSYFFREANRLNAIEKAAIRAAKGKVLDIGAGAGCHTLILQNLGSDVVALERSEKLCQIMKMRGVRNVIQKPLLDYSEGKFDTVLLLMNGFGLAGTSNKLPAFISHLASRLLPGGMIIGDSTDISYFFRGSDGNVPPKTAHEYFGNVKFCLKWGSASDDFPWLFADEWLLREVCQNLGLRFSILKRTSGDQFLCCISVP